MDKGMNFTSDALKWDALVRRDRQAEGAFLYGVKTTGVYCRPVCASRVPRRANVSFFADAEEAVRSGFRACKRCKPNYTSPHDQRRFLIERACELIEGTEERPTLNDLAAAMGLSASHFQRVFKQWVGVTPKEYVAATCVHRIQDGLQEGDLVTSAIYNSGFRSSSRFYDGAIDTLGMTPSEYKNGAANIDIQFAVGHSFLGWALVAATKRGICAIDFGEAPEILVERLRARFRKGQIKDGDLAFASRVVEVLALIETPQQGRDLPLHIRGTAFRRRVWRALQKIPSNATANCTAVTHSFDIAG